MYHGLFETTEPAAGEISQLRVMAHVENVGDHWADADGWAGLPSSRQRVEGVKVEFADPAASLSCQVLTQENVLSAPVGSGVFCGTKGARQAILGFRVNIVGGYSSPLRVRCWARFIDGTAIGPVPGGTLCCAATRAPLEALRIEVAAG
jgi:hypothetical protein